MTMETDDQRSCMSSSPDSSRKSNGDYRTIRDRNNIAVRKCRQKSKLERERLEASYQKEKSENALLKHRVSELEQRIELEKKKSMYLEMMLKAQQRNQRKLID